MSSSVNALHDKLDALRLLYGSEFVEEVLDGIIDRKRRLNRLVQLKSKVIVTVDEQDEIRFLERLFKRYVYNLAREKAEARQFLLRTRWPTSASRI
jgi:anion-transporting  ArsA/GET3 family ATPase